MGNRVTKKDAAQFWMGFSGVFQSDAASKGVMDENQNLRFIRTPKCPSQ